MTAHRHIVLNRIKNIDLTNAPPRKRGVIKLLDKFSNAVGIQFEGKCSICKRPGLMSFRLPMLDTKPPFDGYEQCGFFCSACGWGNAGSREIWRRKYGKKVGV